MKKFEFDEDKKYFVDVLCNGNEEIFDKYYLKLFDFRDPQIKRKELNIEEVKAKIKTKQKTCQLRISPDCMGDYFLQVEHLIPVSTNKLNKKLRNIIATPGRKVPSQSFGSNHISNLILACEKCNSLKKHRLPDEIPIVKELLKKRVYYFH
jgi:5-methylcytosine-specific restriction endonuclease McrA